VRATPDGGCAATLPTLFILNPNSTAAVTAGLDAAMAPMRAHSRIPITCLDLPGGPAGVQTQHDLASVALPLLAQARGLVDRAGAFVIACFSDPGLALLREQLPRPVLGIGEAGVLTALTLGQRFGVVAILPGSIPRHHRRWAEMGVAGRLAGERALGLGVTELADRAQTLARALAVGQRLRDDDGAEVLVLGCAGMAWLREPLQQALGLPVVEPTLAATAMALGRISWGDGA
jgi:Asp/Glu/hydantoin racemase